MACGVVEIEKQVPEILYRFTPDKGIDYCPDRNGTRTLAALRLKNSPV